MERSQLVALTDWKADPGRKPLILRGARQVGKTWLLKEFGARCYSQTVYVRLEDNAVMEQLFAGSLEPRRLVEGISAATGQHLAAADTLLILDEAQAVPRALTAMKYFSEDAPEYHIVLAGSLLGIALHSGISFPVGKVSFLDLYPLSFTEFLTSLGEDALVGFIKRGDFEMLAAFRERLTDYLRLYYYVGGMPEVVQSYLDHRDFTRTRAIQQDILQAYEHDFSKHLGTSTAQRCREVWASVPRQLSKENKKFTFGAVRPGGRGRHYDEAIQILADCGLVTKVMRVGKPGIPLTSYEDSAAFKLFMVDTGLLAAMSDVPSEAIMAGSTLFEEFKGALAEQYVCQQLIADCKLRPGYWSADRSSGEVDFLYQTSSEVVPVEVKATVNLKSKSLASFCKTYSLQNAIRLSLADYKQQDWLTNLPLYAVACLPLSKGLAAEAQ